MCKVSGNGRFAGATLLIQNRDDLHKHLYSFTHKFKTHI